MRISKEAIKGNQEAIQELIDSLSEEVSFSQYPGDVKLNGSIQDKIVSFLNQCFSIDYPELSNDLKLFNRITTVRRLFDSLTSLNVVWFINNSDISKTEGWCDRVDQNFKTPKQFAETLPVTMRINALTYTIVEYNGSLRVGGTWRKEKNAFGTSLKIEMKMKYANAEDFYVKLDPNTTNRFQDLDLDSRKLEYSKVQHTPFKSLFKVGKDFPLFRKDATSIKPALLGSIAIVSENGFIEGGLTGIQGDSKKTDIFFKENKLNTVVEIEGMKVWDGKLGSSIEQTRLLRTLIDEASTIPEADTFLRVECDIQVFVLDPKGDILFKQLGTLALRKIRNDFLGTIVEEKSLVKVEKPAYIDLERLERDNTLIKNIQSEFENTINRSTEVTYKPDTKDFDLSVLAFLQESIDVMLPESLQKDFNFALYLDKEQTNIVNIKSMDELKLWKEFKGDVQWYDYTSPTTEEFIFDVDVDVSLNTERKEEGILKYTGTFSIELESPIKTILSLSLKAKKLKTSMDTEYIPKRTVNRYMNLDLD